MKIWKISQKIELFGLEPGGFSSGEETSRRWHETLEARQKMPAGRVFECAVVVAETEGDARSMHPGEDYTWDAAGGWICDDGVGDDAWGNATWTPPTDVLVEEIGAGPGPARVICASFNA